MNILRTVRRSRALTLLELARLTGLPVRLIAEAEYGLRSLSDSEYAQLAAVFDLPVETLQLQPQPQLALPAPAPPLRTGVLARFTLLLCTVTLLIFGLALGVVYLPPLEAWHTLATAQEAVELPLLSVSPTPVLSPTETAIPPTETATLLPTPTETATLLPTPTETATLVPSLTPTPVVLTAPGPPVPVAALSVAPTAPPVFSGITEAGPVGCPLQPAQGRVVMTQGYGVGSHAPADVWGAVDLAVVDGSKDLTRYTPVVATHDGVAYVSLGSWPGGNHVSIVDPATGWRTGYSHLEYVFIESGTTVTAGNYIGLAGGTGQATGPHLDYQVWYGDTNIDPTSLVQACR